MGMKEDEDGHLWDILRAGTLSELSKLLGRIVSAYHRNINIFLSVWWLISPSVLSEDGCEVLSEMWLERLTTRNGSLSRNTGANLSLDKVTDLRLLSSKNLLL